MNISKRINSSDNSTFVINNNSRHSTDIINDIINDISKKKILIISNRRVPIGENSNIVTQLKQSSQAPIGVGFDYIFIVNWEGYEDHWHIFLSRTNQFSKSIIIDDYTPNLTSIFIRDCNYNDIEVIENKSYVIKYEIELDTTKVISILEDLQEKITSLREKMNNLEVKVKMK